VRSDVGEELGERRRLLPHELSNDSKLGGRQRFSPLPLRLFCPPTLDAPVAREGKNEKVEDRRRAPRARLLRPKDRRLSDASTSAARKVPRSWYCEMTSSRLVLSRTKGDDSRLSTAVRMLKKQPTLARTGPVPKSGRTAMNRIRRYISTT
jgi:hypothetical protein